MSLEQSMYDVSCIYNENHNSISYILFVSYNHIIKITSVYIMLNNNEQSVKDTTTIMLEKDMLTSIEYLRYLYYTSLFLTSSVRFLDESCIELEFYMLFKHNITISHIMHRLFISESGFNIGI